MSVEIYEIVKQYLFWVDGLDYKVKGRISRNLKPNVGEPFMWEISHHYKPSDKAGVYYPSKVSAGTLEDAERLLLIYAKAFTNIGVKANEDF
jgi:hypothetical protein